MEEKVLAFRSRMKSYTGIFFVVLLSPFILILLSLLGIIPIINFVINMLQDYLYVFLGGYGIALLILRFLQPSIKCECCNEDLTRVYLQSKKAVIACPYCAASLKSH